MRRILGVRWQDRIRNNIIREITDVPYVDEIMMRGRWRWLGNALRTGPGICKGKKRNNIRRER